MSSPAATPGASTQPEGSNSARVACCGRDVRARRIRRLLRVITPALRYLALVLRGLFASKEQRAERA